jgi:hypothetical protein
MVGLLLELVLERELSLRMMLALLDCQLHEQQYELMCSTTVCQMKLALMAARLQRMSQT